MTKKRSRSIAKEVKLDIAKKAYINPNSPGFLNKAKALEIAGYSQKTALKNASSLLEDDSLKDILPSDSQNLGVEIQKWMELLAKWRQSIEKVKDPVKLGSRTFATVSHHLERLFKLAGLYVQRTESKRLNVNIDFEASLTIPERLEEMKVMREILDAEIKRLEEKGRDE